MADGLEDNMTTYYPPNRPPFATSLPLEHPWLSGREPQVPEYVIRRRKGYDLGLQLQST
jgi:hypothetical protein